jgi:hypothetical protein
MPRYQHRQRKVGEFERLAVDDVAVVAGERGAAVGMYFERHI